MKKLLLLLILSFGFVLSAQADSIPSISTWYDCQDKLKKQKISSSNRLCSDKYAEKIPQENTNNKSSTGISMGGNMIFTFKPENKSQYYVITKTDINVWLECRNKSECNRQEYDYSLYTAIEPGTKPRIPNRAITEIMFPDNYLDDFNWDQVDYGFGTTSYGFKIDY